MADLGFLPGVRRIMDKTPRKGQRMLFSATLDKAIDVLVKRYLDQADDPRGRLGAVAGRHHAPPRAAPHARAAGAGAGRPDQRARPYGRLHPHQARRQGAGPPAQQERACRRVDLHGNLSPERAHAQHGGVPLRQGHDAGRDRHRRPRHPRRRRRARDPRRPADRAQGLPAPLGPYGPRRRRGHRDHPDDRRAAARRARPDPSGRHQADHHQGQRSRPRDARAARARRAQHVPGGLVVDVPVSTGGGGRSTGANAQRKRARSTGQTNGQSRRGNPTGYTSETPSAGSTGGGQRRRSGAGQGGQGGQGRAGRQPSSLRRRPVRRPARSGGRAHSASSFSRGR